MMYAIALSAVSLLIIHKSLGQPQISEECRVASMACEDDTDCVHRLAVLQSTCVTNTCQPQCRNAVLNLYQNRLGRSLLRTDVSCVPGRYELQLCNLLPNSSTLHCNLAKLACEADMECNAKWGVFVSECEVDASHGRCSQKCLERLMETFSTRQGLTLANCTCTKRDDQLCDQLRDVVLKACATSPSHPVTPTGRQPTKTTTSTDSTGAASTTCTWMSQFMAFAPLSVVLLFRWSLFI